MNYSRGIDKNFTYSVRTRHGIRIYNNSYITEECGRMRDVLRGRAIASAIYLLMREKSM